MTSHSQMVLLCNTGMHGVMMMLFFGTHTVRMHHKRWSHTDQPKCMYPRMIPDRIEVWGGGCTSSLGHKSSTLILWTEYSLHVAVAQSRRSQTIVRTELFSNSCYAALDILLITSNRSLILSHRYPVTTLYHLISFRTFTSSSRFYIIQLHTHHLLVFLNH